MQKELGYELNMEEVIQVFKEKIAEQFEFEYLTEEIYIGDD